MMPDPLSTGLDGLAVTGATGRIGTLLRGIWSNDGTDGIAWLARSDEPLPDMLRGRRTLLALAGVTCGDAAAIDSNVTLAIGALDAARDADLDRVFLVSSAAVYGRVKGRLSEDRAPAPISPYGAAKARMEAAAAEWTERHPDGPQVTCLRLGNVAGADALLGQLNGCTPSLDVFANGRTPCRSYLGPVSLAAILSRLFACPSPLPPVLNVSAPDPVDMADLLRAADRQWVGIPAGVDAIAKVSLDVRVLRRFVDLPEGCASPERIVAEWRGLAA